MKINERDIPDHQITVSLHEYAEYVYFYIDRPYIVPVIHYIICKEGFLSISVFVRGYNLEMIPGGGDYSTYKTKSYQIIPCGVWIL